MVNYFQSSHQFYHTKRSSVPRSVIVTAKDFTWLGPEAWEADLISYMSFQKLKSCSNLGKIPSFLRRKKEKLPLGWGPWILSDATRRPFAWAEGCLYQGAMKTLYLYFAGLQDSPSFAMSALVRLVSACLQVSGADILKLANDSSHWQDLFLQLKIGEKRQIFAPRETFGLSGLVEEEGTKSEYLLIASEEWPEEKKTGAVLPPL